MLKTGTISTGSIELHIFKIATLMLVSYPDRFKIGGKMVWKSEWGERGSAECMIIKPHLCARTPRICEQMCANWYMYVSAAVYIATQASFLRSYAYSLQEKY